PARDRLLLVEAAVQEPLDAPTRRRDAAKIRHGAPRPPDIERHSPDADPPRVACEEMGEERGRFVTRIGKDVGGRIEAGASAEPRTAPREPAARAGRHGSREATPPEVSLPTQGRKPDRQGFRFPREPGSQTFRGFASHASWEAKPPGVSLPTSAGKPNRQGFCFPRRSASRWPGRPAPQDRDFEAASRRLFPGNAGPAAPHRPAVRDPGRKTARR